MSWDDRPHPGVYAKCDKCGKVWPSIRGDLDRLDGIAHFMIGGFTLTDCTGRVKVAKLHSGTPIQQRGSS